jgi:hypothetical protein
MEKKTPSIELVFQEIGAAFNQSLSKVGGWAGFWRRTIVFLISAFALFMPPVALYELYRVKAVKSWQSDEMELLSVERVVHRTRRGGTSWVWSFKNPADGRIFTTSDLRPGDLPSSGPGWSTIEQEAMVWRRQSGQRVNVWKSPDGKEIYPEQGNAGTMLTVLALCAIWWGYRALTALRHR